jgi:hypothetical protein
VEGSLTKDRVKKWITNRLGTACLTSCPIGIGRIGGLFMVTDISVVSKFNKRVDSASSSKTKTYYLIRESAI